MIDLARLSQPFTYRSARVIAGCRLTIAALFALAVWFDPAQPARSNSFGVALLASYLVVAVVLVIVAWRSWWYDHRLALPALVFDVGVFLTAIYFTETGTSDFVSPFLSFFAFMLLASNSRWGWRATRWLALVLSVSFLLVGLELHRQGLPVDLQRFSRRIGYMAIMSVVLVWFGSQNVNVRVPRLTLVNDGDGNVLDEALAYAVRAAGARNGVLAWSRREEPRMQIVTAGLPGPRTRNYPPDFLKLRPGERTLLFNRRGQRALLLDARMRVAARSGRILPDLAQVAPVDQGLLIPVQGSAGHGQLVLGGIDGMCPDFLRLALGLAREIATAIDNCELTEVTRDAAVARLRSSIARDLHDSLAQSLAGATFRLAALRRIIESGGDPLPEITALQASLTGEQAHVRTVIERLRQENIGPGERDLAHHIGLLAGELERQWAIPIRFEGAGRPVPVPALLVFEAHQLVREGVANAVRHGQASAVELSLARSGDQVVLAITDDGCGFPSDHPIHPPRSLAERVRELGGNLVISSHKGNTRIAMSLPQRIRP